MLTIPTCPDCGNLLVSRNQPDRWLDDDETWVLYCLDCRKIVKEPTHCEVGEDQYWIMLQETAKKAG